MTSDPHQDRRDAAAPYVQTFAHLGHRRRRRSRAVPRLLLIVVAAVPVAMLAPGHFPAVIDVAGRFASSILGGVPAPDPPVPAAGTSPRTAADAALPATDGDALRAAPESALPAPPVDEPRAATEAAEDVSADAPAPLATEPESEPTQGSTLAEATPPAEAASPPAEATPPPARPDEAVQVVAAQVSQTAPMGPPAPPTVGSGWGTAPR